MKKWHYGWASGIGILLLIHFYMLNKPDAFSVVFGILLLIGIIKMADIDIRQYEIPNSIQIYFLILGFIRMGMDRNNIISYCLAFLLMGALLWLIAFLSGGKLGGGDIKLMAIAGLCLGLPNIFLALFIGSIIGSIVGIGLIIFKKQKREDVLPFGPFLGTGIYLAYLYGENIWQWYLYR